MQQTDVKNNKTDKRAVGSNPKTCHKTFKHKSSRMQATKFIITIIIHRERLYLILHVALLPDIGSRRD